MFPAYGGSKTNDATMFPAFSGSKSSDTSNNDSGNLDWLVNSSYAAAASQTVLKQKPAKNASDTNEEEKGEINKVKGREEDDDGIQVIFEEDEKDDRKLKRRKKSSKRRRSKSPQSLQCKIEEEILRAATTNRKKIFVEELGIAPEHAFRVDRKGDRNNLAFSSFSHLQIARYHRGSFCIGMTPKQLHQMWSESRSKKSKKEKKKRDARYHVRLEALYNESNIIDLSKSRVSYDADESASLLRSLYWPLQVKVQVKSEGGGRTADIQTITSSVNPLGIYDQNTSLYFEGKSAQKEEQANKSSERKENEFKETTEEYIARMTTEFNRDLRESPNDIQKWIAFMRFQDDAVQFEFGSSKTIGQRGLAEKGLLEKKLAILDKAVENNSKSVELLTMKFDLCKEIWDTDRLMNEWKKTLFIHPNNTWLWKKYLNFFQTRFSAFTVSRYGRLFKKCFEMLRKIHSGTFISHKALPRMEEHMIEIFSHYCHVLSQSGYRERAIANFQALIEFNFFVPESLSSKSASMENYMAFFEPFWDCGVPRFGESEAPGWNNTMKNRELKIQVTKFEDGTNEDDLLDKSASHSENWTKLESSRESRHFLPWRPNEVEDECDDPDRTVLFDDVSAGLFCVRDTNAKFLLVLRFLDFLGIRVEPHLQTLCDFLHCHHQTFIEKESQVLEQCPHFHWRFYSILRKESTLAVSEAFGLPDSDEYRAFIERVIEQSMKLFEPPYKTVLIKVWLSVKCGNQNKKPAKQNAKDAKKFVKNLLKNAENRNDLWLWTEYAKLEITSGNLDEARKVFDVAITSRDNNKDEAWTNLSDEEKTNLCYVHRSASELELQTDAQHVNSDYKLRAIRILVHLGTNLKCSFDETVTSASILKARNNYKTTLNKLLASNTNSLLIGSFDTEVICNRSQLLTEWTMCYALFEYLTEGLTSANDTYEKVVQELEKSFLHYSSVVHIELTPKALRDKFNCELLHIHRIELHVLDNNETVSASIRTLRGVLSQSMQLFPENRQFHSLFLDIEAKSHIAGRLRKYYDSRLKPNTNSGCVSAVYAIVAELERQKNLLESQEALTHILQESNPILTLETGITHRLRALFQKTVRHPDLQNCVLLWRLYLKFEIMQGNYREGKSICYQALQQCPWAKVLYFDAIQHFPNDLQEISDILTEKEIRVRAPLEEVLLLLGTDISQLNNASDKDKPGLSVKDELLPDSDNESENNDQS